MSKSGIVRPDLHQDYFCPSSFANFHLYSPSNGGRSGRGWRMRLGSVEKIRQRRSRHRSVLTYSAYAPRVKMAAALLDGLFGTDPQPLLGHLILGKIAREHPHYSTLPIEKYLVPSRELLAVLQLWRASRQIIFRYNVIPGQKVFETQIHGRKLAMHNNLTLQNKQKKTEKLGIRMEKFRYHQSRSLLFELLF